MGGLEAAKLSFGVAAGARAGWAVGKAVGCLVVIAVILGIFFLLGLFSKLTISSADVPAKTAPRDVATFDRGANNATPYSPKNQTRVTPSIPAKNPRETATATEVSGCLDYGYGNGQPIQTLKGVIEKETFPGPPNYESVEKGDKPETYWIFNLDVPICTSGADQRGSSENNVRKLQLLFAQVDMYKTYRSQLGRPVTVTGSLEHAFSGHHHTDVMLQVTKIE
jgi:Domain of unknown function (DUF4431)